MTGTQINTLINSRCRTNDTTFPQSEKLTLVNLFKDEICSMIVERNAGYFLIPSTFSLVADQREYSFDDTVLNRLQKLEIKFVSTDSRFPAAWIKDYQGSETESEIVKNYSNAMGGFAYTIRRRSILILSGTIITVTAGGRMWWHKFPADLADLAGTTGLEVDPTTTTFGFPRQFHELLARRIAIEYKGRQPKPIPLNVMDLKYDNDLQVQLNAISRTNNDGEIIGEFPEPSAYGNDGFDY